MKHYSTWNEVWIVGNGPSSKSFDLEAWRPGRLLLLNEAAKRVKLPNMEKHAVFSVDGPWVERNSLFLSRFGGEAYVAVPLDTFPDAADIPGVQYLRRIPKDGLTADPEAVHCNTNTGYAAINLAVNKGATLIHLIGYDMDPKDNDQYQFWAPAFRTMKNFLKDRNVRVMNHNPDSFIDAFSKFSLDEVAA